MTAYPPLPDLLKQSVAAFADHPAIIFNGRKTDFATFARYSDHVAGALAAQGIQKGDRVGLYCINSDAFAVAYFGIVKAGATVVPLNLLQNPKEITYILNDARARGLIYHELFSDQVDHIRRHTSLTRCIRIGSSPAPSGELDWQQVLTNAAPPPEITFTPEEDVVAFIYTSGTTGRPKGAMLTHKNLSANTYSIKEALCLSTGKDIFLLVLPMFHAFAATVGMLFPLLHGCTFVPLARFEPELVADTIEKEQATIFMGVPSMYSLLLRLPEQYVPKLASLQYCVSGGAAMPVDVLQRFEDYFGKCIYEGDGPTECSPVTCVNPIGGVRKAGSVGLPVPAVTMKIMDDNGWEPPKGEIGEICVKGPNVMKGYWNLPEETQASFFGEWFRTGDLGIEDEEGYFTILDRKKDMIIVNGMNVYPRIIEEVLYRHKSIAEAAVVGEPHKTHGEIPVAFIVLKEGDDITAADIRAYCKDSLGRYEVPRRVIFVDELPKNATGKILKRQLRKHGELERGIHTPDL